MSLSKITRQMWYNHPFSQRTKTTERAVGVCVGGDREGEWVGGGQNLKKRGEGLGNIREVFLKMEGGC